MVANEQKTADSVLPERNVICTDTVYRTDTIHIKEVITRTDVVHRTERIVRYYDESPDGNILEEKESISQEDLIWNIPSDKIGEPVTVDTVSIPGGHYVWIPDTLEKEVNSVLAGVPTVKEFRSKDTENIIDLNEKVLFRGDTISMILKDRNLGRYDRGLFNFLFIPKGIWQVGLTASYGEFSTSDLQLLDLISDIDFYGKIFSVKPYFQYFFKSNLSLGLKLGYTRGSAAIGSFKVDIDEDMSFNLHDIMYKSNNYSAALTFTQYLGIARKGRFGVFNEIELAFSGGNSDFNRPYNGEMRKTHTTSFQAALNFSPGVCVYVIDPISFNVSLGVFGLNLKHEKQKVNGEDLGSRTTSGANFRFNIFNINFGIAVNI